MGLRALQITSKKKIFVFFFFLSSVVFATIYTSHKDFFVRTSQLDADPAFMVETPAGINTSFIPATFQEGYGWAIRVKYVSFSREVIDLNGYKILGIINTLVMDKNGETQKLKIAASIFDEKTGQFALLTPDSTPENPASMPDPYYTKNIYDQIGLVENSSILIQIGSSRELKDDTERSRFVFPLIDSSYKASELSEFVAGGNPSILPNRILIPVSIAKHHR